MAKITRHGGPSDAHNPDRPDKLLEPHEGGNPVAPSGDAEAPEGPDTPDTAPADASGDQGPESGDDNATPTVELPGVNALKQVWEEACLALHFAPGWVYEDNRTKDQLIEAARGVADGSLVLDSEGVPQAAEGESPGDSGD